MPRLKQQPLPQKRKQQQQTNQQKSLQGSEQPQLQLLPIDDGTDMRGTGEVPFPAHSF